MYGKRGAEEHGPVSEQEDHSSQSTGFSKGTSLERSGEATSRKITSILQALQREIFKIENEVVRVFHNGGEMGTNSLKGTLALSLSWKSTGL